MDAARRERRGPAQPRRTRPGRLRHRGRRRRHGEHAETEDADKGDEATATSAVSDPLGVALGAGGLVAGFAALVVAILAYRRRA